MSVSWEVGCEIWSMGMMMKQQQVQDLRACTSIQLHSTNGHDDMTNERR